MPELKREEIARYLKSVLGPDAHLLKLKTLGESEEKDIKGYGYGTPVQIDYECSGKQHRAVLHTISPGPFGHEHMADGLRWCSGITTPLTLLPGMSVRLTPEHSGATGAPFRLGDAEEFFVLTEYADGRLLRRRRHSDARRSPGLTDLDVPRADALCDYLVEIHRVEGDNPELYVRRIRELIGHSECIMGLIDSYPANRDIRRSRRC